MPVRVGQLRDCIDLLKQVDAMLDNDATQDEYYQTVIEGEWAYAKPFNSGAQYLTTRNVEDRVTHKFWIRFDEDLQNRGVIDHLTFDGRMFEIQNIVLDAEEIRFIVLECRELGLIEDPNPENTYDIRPVAP